MADTFTANIGMLIADLNDTYNFATQAEANFTLIDQYLGLVKCTSSTRPSTTYGGQGIYETDTLRVAVNSNTKASPVWTYVSSNVLVYTSTTRPATNLIAGLLIYESDTDALVRWTGAAWRYATLVVCTSTTRPATGIAAGTQIFETDTLRTGTYSGSAWQMMMPTVPLAGAAMPNALSETIQRALCTTSVAPASGTLTLMSTTLVAGQSVGHIGFCTGATAASGPTHWWVALLDNTYKLQAHSADQLTAALAASTWQSLATVAAYKATYTGQYYLGLMVTTSTTQPTILAPASTPAAQFVTGAGVPTPLLGGTSTTGSPTPGTDNSTTYLAPTAAAPAFYMYAAP